MNLESQIQLLIDNAPQDGITPKIMVSIAPVLLSIAQRLKHLQYFIVQNADQDWVVTTLSNRANPGLEKRVIYAVSTIQDVSLISDAGQDPQVLTTSMYVTQLLFQLMALKTVDSMIFVEIPGSMSKVVEVQRSELERLIEKQLQKYRHKTSSQVPPNIA
jgi:non-ribosomal peptide synthetase component E (peptide arylation enzyme)